jgi:SPP1 gp7 family putative phage head morphogenesis protein
VRTQLLKPVIHRDSYNEPVETELWDFLNETIFAPLAAMLDEAGIHGVQRGANHAGEKKADSRNRANARPFSFDAIAALTGALRSRRVWYADGVFSGDFDAASSRALRELGASAGTLAGKRTYSIDPAALPQEIKSAAEQSLADSQALHSAVGDMLAGIAATLASETVPTGINLKNAVDKITGGVNAQLSATLKPLRAGVRTPAEIPVEITPAMRAKLTAELTQNLNLGIKGVAQEEVEKLRELVEQNALAGYRSEKLIDIIQARLGVGKSRAAFIARNETSLFVSKYAEARYAEEGIGEYVWRTSNDSRVRHDHAILNKRIFSFNQPPIVDQATGRRGNPGSDYNCRCVAIPVMPLSGAHAFA